MKKYVAFITALSMLFPILVSCTRENDPPSVPPETTVESVSEDTAAEISENGDDTKFNLDSLNSYIGAPFAIHDALSHTKVISAYVQSAYDRASDSAARFFGEELLSAVVKTYAAAYENAANSAQGFNHIYGFGCRNDTVALTKEKAEAGVIALFGDKVDAESLAPSGCITAEDDYFTAPWSSEKWNDRSEYVLIEELSLVIRDDGQEAIVQACLGKTGDDGKLDDVKWLTYIYSIAYDGLQTYHYRLERVDQPEHGEINAYLNLAVTVFHEPFSPGTVHSANDVAKYTAIFAVRNRNRLPYATVNQWMHKTVFVPEDINRLSGILTGVETDFRSIVSIASYNESENAVNVFHHRNLSSEYFINKIPTITRSGDTLCARVETYHKGDNSPYPEDFRIMEYVFRKTEDDGFTYFRLEEVRHIENVVYPMPEEPDSVIEENTDKSSISTDDFATKHMKYIARYISAPTDDVTSLSDVDYLALAVEYYRARANNSAKWNYCVELGPNAYFDPSDRTVKVRSAQVKRLAELLFGVEIDPFAYPMPEGVVYEADNDRFSICESGGSEYTDGTMLSISTYNEIKNEEKNELELSFCLYENQSGTIENLRWQRYVFAPVYDGYGNAYYRLLRVEESDSLELSIYLRRLINHVNEPYVYGDALPDSNYLALATNYCISRMDVFPFVEHDPMRATISVKGSDIKRMLYNLFGVEIDPYGYRPNQDYYPETDLYVDCYAHCGDATYFFAAPCEITESDTGAVAVARIYRLVDHEVDESSYRTMEYTFQKVTDGGYTYYRLMEVKRIGD